MEALSVLCEQADVNSSGADTPRVSPFVTPTSSRQPSRAPSRDQDGDRDEEEQGLDNSSADRDEEEQGLRGIKLARLIAMASVYEQAQIHSIARLLVRTR